MSHLNPLLYEALRAALSGGGQVSRDPAKNVYFDDAIPFSHRDAFGFMDDPEFNQAIVNRDNIETAATLFAVGALGLEMGIFRAIDAVLKYVTLGKLDVASSTTAKRIHDYFFLKSTSRLKLPEMQLQCLKVFGPNLFTSEIEVPNGMVVNEGFSSLWQSLMEETVAFIGKYEQADNPDNVSTSNIQQIILDLQQNLSDAASGMAKIMTPTMYANLEDAIYILDSEEVKNQVGFGVARDVWNVVKTINAHEYNLHINTSALLTLADAGRDILLAIADYSPAGFNDTQLVEFIRRVETFIVAKSQLSGGAGTSDRLGAGEEDEYEMVEAEAVAEDWNF